MATKTATVIARVEPEVKSEAEAIINQLGLSASVVINALYKQIILTKSIPFSLSLTQKPASLDQMDINTYNNMMDIGYIQALGGDTTPLIEAFTDIREAL